MKNVRKKFCNNICKYINVCKHNRGSEQDRSENFCFRFHLFLLFFRFSLLSVSPASLFQFFSVFVYWGVLGKPLQQTHFDAFSAVITHLVATFLAVYLQCVLLTSEKNSNSLGKRIKPALTFSSPQIGYGAALRAHGLTHGGDDVVGCHGNVLYPRPAVVVDVLLYLTAATPRCRFVDRHFDRLLVVGDDDRSERRVLRVHRFVVHRPEPMKHQRTLVPVV